jgi:hypothetical protein
VGFHFVNHCRIVQGIPTRGNGRGHIPCGGNDAAQEQKDRDTRTLLKKDRPMENQRTFDVGVVVLPTVLNKKLAPNELNWMKNPTIIPTAIVYS